MITTENFKHKKSSSSCKLELWLIYIDDYQQNLNYSKANKYNGNKLYTND